MLCGGDLVGYAADPEPCVAAIRLACHGVVAGNHDWAVAGTFPADWFHDEAQEAIRWTAAQLGPSTRQELADLPLTWHDDHVTLAHGTLHEPEAFHYLFDEALAAESFLVQRTPVAFVGHTHLPVVFVKTPDGAIQLLRAKRLQVAEGAQYLVDVGSVGQPRDHNPHAAYVLYDTDRRTIEFKRVPYPLEETQAKILAAGLPGRFADRLASGT